MARYVLLSFDSNNEADEFINAVSVEGGIFFMGKDTHFKHIDPEKTFVRGLWAKPTQFCECSGSGAKREGYARGQKFGWWVHNACGKPTKGWARGDHYYPALGKNMLPVTPQAPEWRGEGIVNHRFDPTTKKYYHIETGKEHNAEESLARLKEQLGLWQA